MAELKWWCFYEIQFNFLLLTCSSRRNQCSKEWNILMWAMAIASRWAETNTVFALEDNSVKNKSVKRHLLFAKKTKKAGWAGGISPDSLTHLWGNCISISQFLKYDAVLCIVPSLAKIQIHSCLICLENAKWANTVSAPASAPQV